MCWFWLQWHALTREEQAKYYELARKERQLHMQLYPTWSARDNYVSAPLLTPRSSSSSLLHSTVQTYSLFKKLICVQNKINSLK